MVAGFDLACLMVRECCAALDRCCPWMEVAGDFDEIADIDCGDVLAGFVLIEMVGWFVLGRE